MELPNFSQASIKASPPSAATRGVDIVGPTLQGTTPVPNILFDTFLPRLSDTELRVLLVVNRATLGWKEGTGRKESDWLSHRQLQARTGRAGASVSGAIEALVRRGLLVVQDGSGGLRDSARSRRAARGRLYYRLSDALLTQPPTPAPTLLAESGHCRGRFDTPTSQTEVGGLEQGEENPVLLAAEAAEGDKETASSSLVPLQKAKTTKETGTKEKEEKVSSSPSEVVPAVLFLTPSEPEARKMDAHEAQVERFIRVFEQAYRLTCPEEGMPPVEEADRELLRRSLMQPGIAVLERWLPAFFACSFGYVRRRRWALGCYLNCLFILQAQAGTKTPQ